MAIALCLFLFLLTRRYHRQQTTNNGQRETNNATCANNVYSIYTRERQNEYVNAKLPDLPNYTPPMNPPSYDEIDHYEQPGDEDPPIYEELQSKSDTHVYENVEQGYVNTGFINDSRTMEYMKI